MGMAHEGKVGAVPLAVGIGFGQVGGGLGRGQQAVAQAGQDGKLVAAGRAATRRHHGGSVPA